MRDAIKTLYEHWINVHTTSSAEKLAFEAINKGKRQGNQGLLCL